MVRRRRRRRSVIRPLWRALWAIALAFVALTTVPVWVLRWVDPPTSSVMLFARLEQHLRGDGVAAALHHEWVPWSRIPPVMALAVVAAEDQRFADHAGFDWVEVRRAWANYQAGERLRGASTISQQVAKNLFLWHGRHLVRKGLEAWFTLLIEALWPKSRILAVYLNIAQLGPTTYGVGAASWRFFDRPAEALTTQQAALLAAVLPNPVRYRAEAPSPYVKRRAAWIRRQMERLGGVDHLQRLESY